MAPSPENTRGGSCRICAEFYRGPEEIEKEEWAAAEKAVTKEEFQGGWTAPELTATQPEGADRSEGAQVPSLDSAVPHGRLGCSAFR